MGRRLTGQTSRRCGRLSLRISLLAVALALVGCTSTLTEGDLAQAKTSVQRAIMSATYEDFLRHFASENQERMREAPVWIRWWQEKMAKNRTAWAVSAVRDGGQGVAEVTVQSRRMQTSRQFYSLIRQGHAWVITKIESER